MSGEHDDPAGGYLDLAEGRPLRLNRVIGTPDRSHWAARFVALECDEWPDVLRAVLADSTVVRFDARTGRVLRRTALDLRRGGNPRIDSARFAGDGALVVVSYIERAPVLFDAASGVPRLSLEMPRAAAWCRIDDISADGQLIYGGAYGGTRETFVWDVRTGAISRTVDRGLTAPLVVGGARVFGTARYYDALVCLSGRDLSQRWIAKSPLFHARNGCTSDGELAFVCGDVESTYWNHPKPDNAALRAYGGDDGALRWEVRLAHRSVALRASRDGRVLWVVTHEGALAFACDTGRLLADASDEVAAVPGTVHPALAVSHDGSTLYLSKGGRLLRVSEALERPRLDPPLREHVAQPVLAVSPSGRLAVAVNEGNSLRVWDVSRGDTEWLLEGFRGAPTCAVFAPDERSLFAYSALDGRAFDLSSGLVVFDLPAGGKKLASENGGRIAAIDEVQCVALSDDGALLFAAGTVPKGFRVRASSVSDGSLRWTFTGDGPAPHALRLDAAGRALLASRFDAQGTMAFSPSAGSPTVTNFGRWINDARIGEEQAVWATHSKRGWFLERGALYSFRDRQVQRHDPPDDQTFAVAPFCASRDGAWIVTGSLAGDALLWRVEAADDAVPEARVLCRVRLSLASDALAQAGFDRAGETLLLRTARGVFLVCALSP